MKKHRLYAVLAAMSVALALVLAGCQQPSSGGSDSSGSGAASGSSETGDSGNTSGGGSVAVDWSKAKVGDIVLTDGTFVSPTDFTTDMEAVAVIVRAKSESTPALGVGIHRGSTTLKWCTSSANGYSKKIEALLKDSCKDGSKAWEELKAVCDDAGKGNDKELYPAWDFCNTYGTTYGLTGELATGWYLPAIEELQTIYKDRTTINSSLEKAGGDKFDTNYYWSCCPSSTIDDYALELYFYDGVTYSTFKTSTYNVVCSVRAFN